MSNLSALGKKIVVSQQRNLNIIIMFFKIFVHQAAKNGGTCIRRGKCQCPHGYAGLLCENKVTCSPGCMNNGICYQTNKCRCLQGYEGDICTIPICNPECKNNGTCSEPDTCLCENGYEGDLCEVNRHPEYDVDSSGSTNILSGSPVLLPLSSIKNKKPEVDIFTNTTQPDIIIGTETWLDPKTLSYEYFSKDQYTVLRKDRPPNKKGQCHEGILIAISNIFLCTEIKELDTGCEMIWLELLISNALKCYICAYRPQPDDYTSLDLLNESLSRINARSKSAIIVNLQSENESRINFSEIGLLNSVCHETKSNWKKTTFCHTISVIGSQC
ncbi:WIF1 [Mytilus coruscus]|uniref:WIF1 n=1 Tax=Mytilus coruscus TaxID=42192 RepID=A0A6J8DLU1_MYTCO|nr:WIF1 [Mytilus coruscus]